MPLPWPCSPYCDVVRHDIADGCARPGGAACCNTTESPWHFKVEGVDRGSMWLVLVGSTVMVVKFTFEILYAAHDYMRKQAELDRYVQDTRAIGTRNEHMTAIETTNAKMMEGLGDALTKQLLGGRAVEPEAVATTLIAIKTLAELRKQGLDMQLAANAPKELKEEYRDFVLSDMDKLMSKELPQLTEGAKDLGTT
ncbi:MAG: hypothetical protein FWD69_15950 [Polyangiaceae bacterium]|nr:hypothetical protein [Polyangiaceae bacterium]